MNRELQVALCRSITRRAHLAGAEAAELKHEAQKLFIVAAVAPRPAEDWQRIRSLAKRAAAASRRYWREVHHAALLQGWSWPEAEALGREQC